MNDQKLSKIIKICLVIIVIVAIILLFSNRGDTAKLELIGSNPMTINQYDRYLEPGYAITETDDTSGFYINIDGFVNTNKAGIYNLVYMLYNKKGALVSQVERQVIVLENSLVYIDLKGDEEEYFFVDSYIDHGVEAYRGSVDITNEIKVVSDINPSIPGTYEVRYQITNNNNINEAIRRVHIIDYEINKEIDETNLIIDLNIKCDDYYYTILPDGSRSYSKYVSYFYNDIGEYEFDIYLKNESHKKYVVNIDSIDREGPRGTCTVYYENNITTINMNVTDKSGVSKYSVNGLDFYNNTTTLNTITPNLTVKAYDKHNNYTDIKCKAELGAGFRSIPLDDDGHVQNKSGWITCGSSVAKDNQELDNLMQSYGYKTRAAVAMAATFLANYRYNIPYFWGGKTIAKGIDPTWGCRKSHSTEHNCSKPMAADKSSCQYGLDCGGLVRWAFIQAGFDNSILRGEDIVTLRWGKFNPKEHLYKFNAQNTAYINQIKPGDIVHKPEHVALVIGVDSSTIQVAEMTGPVIITIIRKTNGASINHQNSFTEFLLMDEFYKMYGTN